MTAAIKSQSVSKARFFHSFLSHLTSSAVHSLRPPLVVKLIVATLCARNQNGSRVRLWSESRLDLDDRPEEAEEGR